MKKGVTVTVDKTAEVLKSLRHATSMQLLVGVPMDENARDDGPINNAVIGYINEFGSAAANIPPRPHLVPGVEAVSEKCADILAEGLSDALGGKAGSTDKAYNKAGLLAQASVRRTITAGTGFEELSESTLAARKRKGFAGTKPLIFTGQYRNSISYVLRNR